MRSRKGDIVAFETVPSMHGERTWRIGQVQQATREGRVRYINCDGTKVPMYKRGEFTIGKVLGIPKDQVNVDPLMKESSGQQFSSEEAIEKHVAQYVLEGNKDADR